MLSDINVKPSPEVALAEIAPCPHCGGPGKLIGTMGDWVGKGKGVDGGSYGPMRRRVVCAANYTEGAPPCPDSVISPDDATAIAAWNQRPPQAESGAVMQVVPRKPSDRDISEILYNVNRKRRDADELTEADVREVMDNYFYNVGRPGPDAASVDWPLGVLVAAKNALFAGGAPDPTLDDARMVLIALPTPGILPLDWRKPSAFDRDNGHAESILIAPGFGGVYSIQPDLENFICWRIDDPFAFDTFPTLDAAKAHAEADWQQTAARKLAAAGDATLLRQALADVVGQLKAKRYGYNQGGEGYLTDAEIWERAQRLAGVPVTRADDE
ncbi:hypothetical protein MARCHEWKA_01960 [Brevundimonas phage vB_BpoS-Marchewka]|uniref:Uncharacterized protein n=1 Tax=Brevundimonas phage vB_BpoS-Marchewka TaxID=2948604 RepID=A0A9E7N5H2_9CAUD|nr:hypothetical protein MARCHEWKA_01960 [Brevundimonas phage vB_BpoS-Marchewka]UTC29155.1 hypothetical protein BAMBUS_00720 [Brevundimonas phage vB_BpoS-Bambus]